MSVRNPLGVNYPNPDLGVDRNCVQRGSERALDRRDPTPQQES